MVVSCGEGMWSCGIVSVLCGMRVVCAYVCVPIVLCRVASLSVYLLCRVWYTCRVELSFIVVLSFI